MTMTYVTGLDGEALLLQSITRMNAVRQEMTTGTKKDTMSGVGGW